MFRFEYHAMACLTLLGCLLAFSSSRAEPRAIDPYGDAFWSHWGDGRAELAGYELRIRRYGQPRAGEAVAIFVTETFSDELQVKADPGRHPQADTYPVLKLNLVEDFPTGIYDYNLMTSAFIALTEVGDRPRGEISKLSHSMQEWCGQTWVQFNFREDEVAYTLHSYFDGEADQAKELALPPGAVSEDAVLLWARGLAAPFLAPGESSRRPLLRAARQLRMTHSDPTWIDAKFTRGTEPRMVEVPAGSFEVWENTVHEGNELLWTIQVETAAPHRIVQWSAYPQMEGGSEGRLTGSIRTKYWEQNDPAGSSQRAALGLKP